MTTKRETRRRIKRNKARRLIFRQFTHARSKALGMPELHRAYDREGNAISFRTWVWRFEDPRYRFIKQTKIGDTLVSTIWEGLNHGSWGTEAPAPFETITKQDDSWGDAMRHHSEQEALEYHDAVVKEIKAAWILRRARAARHIHRPTQHAEDARNRHTQ